MPQFDIGSDVWLWLDPSQACNIACELCYTRHSHQNNFLSVEDAGLFCAKLKAAGLTIREVTVNWRGEPLMNKWFPEVLLEVIRAFPEVRVQFHTNGMLLSERVCAKLCAIKKPFYVYLSIDGGTRSSHERNRGIGTFEAAVRGGLTLLRHRGTSEWPHVTLYQLDLRVAEADYDPEFIMLAAKCDAWQRVVPIVRNGSDPISNTTASSEGIDPTEAWDAEAPGPQPSGPCFWVGFSLSVSPTGDVSVCILSRSSDKNGILGNLKTEEVKTIMDRAVSFRGDLHNKGRSHVPHCSMCHKIEGTPRPPRAVHDLKTHYGLHQTPQIQPEHDVHELRIHRRLPKPSPV